MLKVYVAGKYSDDNVLSMLGNIRKGLRASWLIMEMGMTPYCPWADYSIVLQTPDDGYLTVEQLKACSMEWLRVCDAVYVLDNWETSPGTKEEIAVAASLGIPVFYDITGLMKFKIKKIVAEVK